MAGKLAGIVDEFRNPCHGNLVIEAHAGSQADACTCRLADAAIDAHQEMFPAGTRAIRDSWRRGDGSGIVGDKRDRHTAILYGDRYDAVTA